MKILIAGSNGMIGSAVTRHLVECGYEVVRLVRHNPGPDEVWWDPDASQIDTVSLDGFDGVVNMASMPWPMRWTAKAKQKMSANRSGTNRLLAESLAELEHKPLVLVCASGVGYYPPSGDIVLTENSPAGNSFLASLNRAGEAVTASASQAGIRVVHLRIPTVLGGARLKLIGFQAGDGQQWWSWVGLDEVASIIEYVLKTKTLSGPINAVSPNPMRLADFAISSSEALEQKPGGVMPAFLARLFMGEMADEFVLASRRVQPAGLLGAGYQFRFPHLKDALRHEMGNVNTEPAKNDLRLLSKNHPLPVKELRP
jgi:uncharacterized protein